MFTEEEFLEALKQFNNPVPVVHEPRFYYDNQGQITICSTHNHPEGDNYIVVDEETYKRFSDYEIIDGKLSKIKRPGAFRRPLEKSNQGYSGVRGHANIILNNNENYNEAEHYSVNI